MFYKKGVFKNSAEFSTHAPESLLFQSPGLLFKLDVNIFESFLTTEAATVHFAKFLRRSIFKEYLWTTASVVKRDSKLLNSNLNNKRRNWYYSGKFCSFPEELSRARSFQFARCNNSSRFKTKCLNMAAITYHDVQLLCVPAVYGEFRDVHS